MNKMKHILAAFVLLFTFNVAMVTPASAKVVVTPGYIFGMIANFTDSVVYFTDIQTVDSAWYDSKTKFLQGRNYYSEQLRNHSSEQLKKPHSTSIVVFAVKRKDIEKKYIKMKKIYTDKNKGKYDVRTISENEFHFKSVNMAPENQ
ncbi:MAG: hypothetical protein K5764_08525 [Prevotella sp.]|nr:hypothetical protein [Prevotella sp.]